MRLFFTFLSTFFGIFFLFAQKTISGKVTDSEGAAVPSASVTISDAGKETIIAYGITNTKGDYKLTFSTAEPNVEINVKAFNHKPQKQVVKNTDQTANFSLQGEATEIKEVKLKTRIITKKGDTISYDIKAFESKADRSIADVLKKIPGIEVRANGTVLYQGEPINKFYVNGKDLMEGRYGVVNNSLPKDAVQKVEVMENHQPVKVLQDKVPSEQAALNIVLKKQVTMTGRGEAGAGFNEDDFLWNLKLTPMFFGSKNQWVANYKTNNSGESVENEGNMLAFGNAWEGRRVQAGQNIWLNLEQAGTPSVPEQRYLLNNVHFLSANILTNPFKNQEWELKANANYTNNFVKRGDFSLTRDLEFNQTYSSSTYNRFFTDQLKGELIFTRNAKKGFFKNVTSFTQFWNADRAGAHREDALFGSRDAWQTLEAPTTALQNSLSTVIPWKEKLVNLRSYISYQDDKQTLSILPADYIRIPELRSNAQIGYFDWLGAQTARQDFRIKTFQAQHSANLTFKALGLNITPEVGFDIETNDMNSLLSGESATSDINYGERFRNDLRFTQSVPYAAVGISMKNNALQLMGRLPVSFNHISAKDDFRNFEKKLDKATFDPNLFAMYSFASFWKAGIMGSWNHSFGSISDVYAGSILRDPLRFSQMNPENPIAENSSLSAGPRLEYRNPLNNLFFNTTYRRSHTSRNLTPNFLTAGIGTSTVEYLLRDLDSDSNSFSGEIGKYFPKIKTNVSVSTRINSTESEQMRNGLLLGTKLNTQSLGLKFNNTYFKWTSLDYNASLSWNKQRTADLTIKSNGYTHTLAAFFYPFENQIIGFNWDQINSGSGSQDYSNAFFDLSYQYTLTKRKIDLELRWVNIGNRKAFETYSVGTLSEQYSKIELRPAQILAVVKFNFK